MSETVPLYESPLGLFQFQIEDVATAYLALLESQHHAVLGNWDTGTGKTHLAMAVSALMFEDEAIDQVLVVAESNKVLDWATHDFPRFTRLTSLAYKGALTRRRNILAKHPHQVLVCTYETLRNDIGKFQGKAKTPVSDGIMTEFLRGKRTLIVFDEVSKLGNRGSQLYRSIDYLVSALRKDRGSVVMTLGLTATSVERNAATHFNLCRLLAPNLAPRVSDFNERYISAYDQYGEPSNFRNLSPADCDDDVVPLQRVFAPITLRRRKSDPELMAQFPSKIENPFQFVPLGEEHLDFYTSIEAIVSEMDEVQARGQFSLLRQIAGHPESLLASQGKFAQEVVKTVGSAALRRFGSAKTDALLRWAKTNDEQQMVIFTFYGQSILPLLHHRLRVEGYRVSTNHGGMDGDERQRAQADFKSGQTQIFLSSDAGARGLNLGCGSALMHYELPVLSSTYTQRSDRVHRIDSVHPSVTIDALIAQDTVEEGLAGLMTKRGVDADAVSGDDLYAESVDPADRLMSAAERQRMFRIARKAS